MYRRSFIATVGAAAAGALAGCTGDRRLQTGDPATVDAGTIRLAAARATRLLPNRGPVHVRVAGGADDQYVLFVFDVRDIDADDPQAYVRDNTQFQLSPDTVAQEYASGTPVALVEDANRVAAVFELPAPFGVGDDARLNWRGDRSHVWDAAGALSETGGRAYLDDPPVFEVRSFTATRTGADSGTATVRVANAGGTDGTFHALLGSTALSGQPLRSVDVPAGGTVERTVDLDLYRSPDEGESIRLTWGDEGRSVTV